MSAPTSVLFAHSAGGGLAHATFSRTSDAYRRNRDGTVTAATSGYARVEWHDVDGDDGWEVPGLLIEGARTNGWTYSQAFDNAAWSLANATVSADADTAPDGTTTADCIYESTATAEHYLSRASPEMTDNTLQALSVFAKAGTRKWLRLSPRKHDNSIAHTYFNISTGGIGIQSTEHDAFIESYYGGWWRCTVVWDVGSGGTTAPFPRIAVASSDGGQNYAGATSQSIYLWGAQYEADGAFPTSIIPTSAATASRAADSLTFPLNFGVQDVTVYVKMVRPTHADVTGALDVFPDIVRVGGAGNPDLLLYFGSTSRDVFSRIHDGTNNTAAGLSVPSGNPIEVCAQFRNLQSDPQTRIDVSTGFSAWTSTGVVGPYAAFSSDTIQIPDPYGAVQVVKVAQGLATLDDMRNLKTQYGR